MAGMIDDPAEYFTRGCGRCARFDTPDCSIRRWATGLAALRALCQGAGLRETAKWGHPCYMEGDRNIALMGAFREDFRITFFEAGLLDDRGGHLQRPGPNSRTASLLRFTDNAEVGQQAELVRSFLAQTIANARAGRRAPRSAPEIVLPDELTDALDADPDLAEAFDALTPGRQRSYVLALSSAKQKATRLTRIARFRDRIIAGKGATER